MRFVDLFAGLGGFHSALTQLGHECVFASEIDPELRALYSVNFAGTSKRIHGDIRESKTRIPAHDVLCAGFPCQPFSKSGTQNGRRDRTRGTLFHEIIEVLEKHRPKYVLLENVGNFERHNNGRTWKVVRESIEALGYNVRGTLHLASGGHGLISPHHFGHPHTRERFYIVGSRELLADDPFPRGERSTKTTLSDIVQAASELSKLDRAETGLTEQQIECIDHWNALLARLPADREIPSFPIWGDENGASYPYKTSTPWGSTTAELRAHSRLNGAAATASRSELLESFPSYARAEVRRFPDWKIRFIEQNRAWFSTVRRHFPVGWTPRLREFPASLRKLEWNCRGEERDLWQHVLQFRPSGLRVKRYSSSPALVAMTTTQIPILGPKRRFLTRVEGLRLQGFDDTHKLPERRAAAFAALGNAVHVDVVRRIAKALFESN